MGWQQWDAGQHGGARGWRGGGLAGGGALPVRRSGAGRGRHQQHGLHDR